MNCSVIEIVYNNPELRSCPIEATFKIIGKKWTILIIREMLQGTKQFNRFLGNIEGITPKVLTERCVNYKSWGLLREESYPNIQSESSTR
jgi:DNA-binding HxlR family transcriptional regulator